MGRARRVDVGGTIYHALNRANFRSRLFRETAHYGDFPGIVEENLNFLPVRIPAYCLMPNHWHLVLYPRAPEKRSLTPFSRQSQGKKEIENTRSAMKMSVPKAPWSAAA